MLDRFIRTAYLWSKALIKNRLLFSIGSDVDEVSEQDFPFLHEAPETEKESDYSSVLILHGR